MQEVVADILNALKTAAGVSVAAALHADTAACKHPEVADVAVAAGGDDGAVSEVAVISNLPVVIVEVLYAVVADAEGAPDPIRFQGHFQVSAILLVCGYQIHQEQGL